MIVYELHTNEDTILKRREPTLKQMYEYIKAKRKQGYRPESIIYCWTKKRVRF